MSNANLYNVNIDAIADANIEAAQPFGAIDEPMNARLNESDRRAVDYILDGGESVLDASATPLARNAFMDRVNSARRVLSLLDALPGNEPSTSLLEATLAKLPPADEQPASSVAPR